MGWDAVVDRLWMRVLAPCLELHGPIARIKNPAGCTQRKQVLEASALVCSSSAMPCMAEHCGNV